MPMKVVAVNGSPRKRWNTATLLSSFLDGAKSVSDDVTVETVDLFDFDYKGCSECYACKMKGGASYGKCAKKDDISPLLERMADADVIVFGSPIYFAGITGELHSFLERFLYPFTAFQKIGGRTIAPKKIRTAFIYTMNISESGAEKAGYSTVLAPLQNAVGRTFGYPPEVLCSYFTYQYSDYSKYVSDLWDVDEKEKWREEHFPADCQSAFDLGKKLAEAAQITQ